MTNQTKKRIVVIEDNAPDIFLLEEALAQAHVDCDLISLSDGEQARTYLMNSAHGHPPDLLLLDLNLPKLNGRELLELIRRQPALACVPVVVWSSFSDKRLIEQFGVKYFFTKPCSLDAFVEIGEVIRGILAENSALTAAAGK
ncbi:MAG: response regulator [Bryobacterales bacterium]|nr:response regulator [Bryobacterales bacterium]